MREKIAAPRPIDAEAVLLPTEMRLAFSCIPAANSIIRRAGYMAVRAGSDSRDRCAASQASGCRETARELPDARALRIPVRDAPRWWFHPRHTQNPRAQAVAPDPLLRRRQKNPAERFRSQENS